MEKAFLRFSVLFWFEWWDEIKFLKKLEVKTWNLTTLKARIGILTLEDIFVAYCNVNVRNRSERNQLK